MTVSIAATTTPQEITLPSGGTVLTNSTTGKTVYMISNPSTAETAALIGGSTTLAAVADGFIDANQTLVLGGNIERIAMTTTGTAALTMRFGQGLRATT